LSLCGGHNVRLCPECADLSEITELKKVIRERVFDASNEGDMSMEKIDMPFHKIDPKRTRSQIITRGQSSLPITRTKQNHNSIDKINRISHIILEEELDVASDNRSPYIGAMASNKISAIGLDDATDRMPSPFWDNESAFEMQ
jgi:predicted DNA-binding protein YlxM (UPF0122 family)